MIRFIVLMSVLVSSFAHAETPAEAYSRLKFTGKKNGSGVPIYYDPSAAPGGMCKPNGDARQYAYGSYNKLTGKEDDAKLCQDTCDLLYGPILFLMDVAAKKNPDGTWVTVPWGSPADGIFFCGFNPESGVKWDGTTKKSSDNYSTAEEVALANQLCKNGNDANCILDIGLSQPNKEECAKYCTANCPKILVDGMINGKCKTSMRLAVSCMQKGGRLNTKSCGCDPIVRIPIKKYPVLPPVKPGDVRQKLNFQTKQPVTH